MVGQTNSSTSIITHRENTMQEQVKAVIDTAVVKEIQESIVQDILPVSCITTLNGITLPKERKTDPTKALGSIPQEIYSREEYCSDSMLYLIMPQHEVAIPYGRSVTPLLLETIADTLLKNRDVKSSQIASDYPIVTHVQLEMWYSHYKMIEQLKVVEVYKPTSALSGWELQRKKETHAAAFATAKKVAEFKADKIDMFLGGEETQGQPTSYRITPDRKAEIREGGK